MKNSTSTLWKGVGFILGLGLLALFVYIGASVYHNLQKVEQDVYNLNQQIRANNQEIKKFNVADEEIARETVKFTEATKNWKMYQNEQFDFQLKTPAKWGTIQFESALGQETHVGELQKAIIPYLQNQQAVSIYLAGYDFSAKGYSFLYATDEIKKELNLNLLGECSDTMFSQLKSLNIGEIRNCYVRENILKQKFIIFRHVWDSQVQVNELVAVFPRDNYYLTIVLPKEISDELDYFIQSVVFMK